MAKLLILILSFSMISCGSSSGPKNPPNTVFDNVISGVDFPVDLNDCSTCLTLGDWKISYTEKDGSISGTFVGAWGSVPLSGTNTGGVIELSAIFIPARGADNIDNVKIILNEADLALPNITIDYESYSSSLLIDNGQTVASVEKHNYTPVDDSDDDENEEEDENPPQSDDDTVYSNLRMNCSGILHSVVFRLYEDDSEFGFSGALSLIENIEDGVEVEIAKIPFINHQNCPSGEPCFWYTGSHDDLIVNAIVSGVGENSRYTNINYFNLDYSNNKTCSGNLNKQ